MDELSRSSKTLLCQMPTIKTTLQQIRSSIKEEEGEAKKKKKKPQKR
jgi:hypothetical protein